MMFTNTHFFAFANAITHCALIGIGIGSLSPAGTGGVSAVPISDTTNQAPAATAAVADDELVRFLNNGTAPEYHELLSRLNTDNETLTTLHSRAPPGRPAPEYKFGAQDFIGYSGTDEPQAKLYSQRVLKKISGSGRGSKLGEGIYLTDTLSVATTYAMLAAQKSKKPPFVCIFYAEYSWWRQAIRKVWLPTFTTKGEKLRGDTPAQEALRVAYTQTKAPTVRLSWLDDGANMLVLMDGTTDSKRMAVGCYGVNTFQPIPFAKLGYYDQSLSSLWDVKDFSGHGGKIPKPVQGW